MDVYRVALKKYALDLTGEGAKIAGGRWNDKGTPVIYAAEHPSLALLETLPGFDLSLAPPDIMLVTITLPADLTILTITEDKLPANWRAYPHKPATVSLGRKWIHEQKASVLKVPSVMAPSGCGWNFILNPLHPELNGKMTVKTEMWELDKRLEDRLK